jgi:hypothetical protein
MRLPIRLALLALTFALAGCGISLGGGGMHYSYVDVTVTVSPSLTSLPVNATQQFTATVQNAPNDSFWSADVGTIPLEGGIYTAPATPPVYTQAEVAAGKLQGHDTVTAQVMYFPVSLNNFMVAYGSQSFIITAPSVTAGITPAAVTVPLGTTQQFTPYAVGSTNLAYTLQVGGVTGGSLSLGTIDATGLYTAPATMPMTGATVVITVISQADPTKSATATVTLQ